MRTITAAQANVRASGNQAEHCQVLIDNGSGSGLVDVATLVTPGTFNPVKAVVIKDSIDNPCATLDVTLHREMYKWSLSPYVAASGMNRIGAGGKPDPTTALNPMLRLGNRVVVKFAIVPFGRQPGGSDWMTVFDGKIETLDAARGRDVNFTAMLSPAGRLAKQYIRFERVYAFADDGGQVSLRVWETGTDYPANQYILPASRGTADPGGSGEFFFTGSPGTSGMTEPDWSLGSPTDGSIVWGDIGPTSSGGFSVESVMQSILDDNKGAGDSSVTLNTPSSPGWMIRQFIQQRSFTLDAIRTLAQQIGWDVRPKWNSGSSSFLLTFYVPSRSSPSVDQTFQISDYEDPTQLGTDISVIRNYVRVVYADRSDLWPDGTPKRKVIEVQDSSSISKYGEMWMEIQEDETGNIDSSTEATTLANAALSDCKEPTAQLSVPLTRGYPWVELNDYYTFKAGLLFDSDQSLAVTSYTQTFEASGTKTSLRTQLELRGKPTIGADKYINAAYHPNAPTTLQTAQAGAHQLAHFQGFQTPSIVATNTVGGTRFQLTVDVDKRALEAEYEIHVYPTPGTTLSPTTLKSVTKSRSVEIADLIPGKAYYVRSVPRYYNRSKLIRGQPSAEVPFTAGQASAGHLNDGIALGDYPLNGGFETRVDTAGMPDHWNIIPTFGVFGTDVQVMEDGNGISGGRYLRVIGKVSGSVVVQSAVIPIINEAGEAHRYSQLYRFSLWSKAATANTVGFVEVAISFYDYTGALVTTSSTIVVSGTTKKTHWIKSELYVRADSSTSIRSALITLTADAGGSATYTVDVDEVRLQWVGTRWYNVGDTTAFTENYDSIPPFNNSYTAHADEAPAFRKNAHGRVYLKGAAKHTTTSTVNVSIFTLPSPFWPIEKQKFVIDANGKAASLEVSTAGVVTMTSAVDANPSTKVSLDGCSWETFN